MAAATALSAIGGPAWAQEAANTGQLSEVVVTATRRSETVNRVPLSITALSSENLDQQGIRSIADLARSVPALTFRRTGSDGTTVVAIRGIFSLAGSPSTGIFLDDVPLQKRLEGASSAGGTTIPALFDLERVEVLRGPQGTLFGGSSQGGAVRFITPTPSLTRYSVYGRAEGSLTREGSASGSLGVAIGGPIIADKLGFRVSVQQAHSGGWIDHVAPQSGATWAKDTNAEDQFSLHGSLRWAPTSRDSIQLSAFISRQDIDDTDFAWKDVPAYTAPAGTFDAAGLPTTNPALIRFSRPAINYPALNFYGPYITGHPAITPRRNELNVASLSYDHDFGWASFKSISSIVDDHSTADANIENDLLNTAIIYGGWLRDAPGVLSLWKTYNNHTSLTQEFRLSSAADSNSRLSWVIGAFYQRQTTSNGGYLYEEADKFLRALRGVDTAGFYGFSLPNGLQFAAQRVFTEKSLAGFGEANFALTPKFKVTAGVRVSRETLDITTSSYGPVVRIVPPATIANTGIQIGQLRETPITPKFGLSYQLTPNDLLYANVSRGFRAGGANNPLPVQCAGPAAAVGGTPSQFAADYTLSYEAGAKLRLFNGRAQVNSSVFRTDWTGVQTRLSLPGCSFFYIDNVGNLVSQGFDTQATIRVTDNFTLDVAVGYADVAYKETVTPRGSTQIIVNKGDTVPAPAWTFNIGARYDFMALGHRAYVRGDFDYGGSYKRTFGPNSSTYAPDIYDGKPVYTTNLRAGMVVDRFDVSLFVNNLFSFKGDYIAQNGRAGCLNTQCTSFRTNWLNIYTTTVRPTTAGMTVTYRY